MNNGSVTLPMSCNEQITDKQYATFLIFTAYLTHSLLNKMKKPL